MLIEHKQKAFMHIVVHLVRSQLTSYFEFEYNQCQCKTQLIYITLVQYYLSIINEHNKLLFVLSSR